MKGGGRTLKRRKKSTERNCGLAWEKREKVWKEEKKNTEKEEKGLVDFAFKRYVIILLFFTYCVEFRLLLNCVYI